MTGPAKPNPLAPAGAAEVDLECRAGVAYVFFNRPDARNALTFPMYDRVQELCRQVDADASVRVLVLRGRGGHFAAGTDISQFADFDSRKQAIEYERLQDRVMAAIEGVSKPTIAAIEGVATGGGAMMAACCDLRVMSTNARIGIPIARTLGNCLSIQNCQRLVRLVGEARLKELIFTARLLTAAEALTAGLVNRVLEEDSFDVDVTKLAESIAAMAPITLRVTKEELRRIADHERIAQDAADDLIAECYLSADFREGVAAFLGKRAPKWSGS
jgi:enoyl-CoA hydratase/carnithine racemase